MTTDFSTALIISTYNNPAFLRLCLESVLAQSVMPAEILIADDGSTSSTADLIEEYAAKSPVRLVHMWQPDLGFRKTRILNKAILESTADYLLFIDGDILLHRHFVKDHERFARPGSFVTGSRVKLSPELTGELVESGDLSLSPIGKGRKSGLNGLRLPLLTPLFAGYKSSDGTYARGCNMAVWRTDLERVNGFNADIEGWGREDSELSWRLINAGLRKRFLKWGGIEYHLHHAEFSRELDARNYAIMEAARDGRVVAAAHGLREHTEAMIEGMMRVREG